MLTLSQMSFREYGWTTLKDHYMEILLQSYVICSLKFVLSINSTSQSLTYSKNQSVKRNDRCICLWLLLYYM